MATVELIIPFGGDYTSTDGQPVAHGHFRHNAFISSNMHPHIAAALDAHTSGGAGLAADDLAGYATQDQTGYDNQLDAADPFFTSGGPNGSLLYASQTGAPQIADEPNRVDASLIAVGRTTRSGDLTATLTWYVGGAVDTFFNSANIPVSAGDWQRIDTPNKVLSGFLSPDYLNPVLAAGDSYMSVTFNGGATPQVGNEDRDWIGQATDDWAYLAVRLSWFVADVAGRMPPLRQVQRGDGLVSSVPRAVQNNSRQASHRSGRAFI